MDGERRLSEQWPEAEPEPGAAGFVHTGVGALAVGLAVSGAAAYGFLILTARALGPSKYAGVAAVWFLGYFIGPGIFVAVEQKISRDVARPARNEVHVDTTVTQQAGAVVAGAVIGLTLLCHRLLADRFFGGDIGLVLAFAGVLLGCYVEHAARGMLAGRGHLRKYAQLVSIEALLRLAAAGVLVVAGVRAPSAYGAVVAVAPFAAIGLLAVRTRYLRGIIHVGFPAVDARTWTALVDLAGASFVSQLIINAAPVLANAWAGEDDRQLLGRFAAALVLARAPLLLFGAVQTATLTSLASAIGTARQTTVVKRYVRLLGAVTGGVVLGAAVAFAAGEAVLTMVFGGAYSLANRHVGALGVIHGLHLLSLLLAQPLLAIGRTRTMVVAWAAAAVLVGGALIPGGELLWRIERSLMAGELVAVGLLGVSSVRLLRPGGQRARRRNEDSFATR